MKEAYLNPEMKVVPFLETDILCCSNGDGDVSAEEATTAWVPNYNDDEPGGKFSSWDDA